MDLRNLCSKFVDVDSMRAKIPPLPSIKLPKSITKLKSRKIFRSSRDDVNAIARRSSSKRLQSSNSNLQLPYHGAPSEFINRTPTRISTISSLMSVTSKTKIPNDDENSYHNAGGIDDYYPSPLSHRFEQRVSKPISPIKAPPMPREYQAQSQENIEMSFSERVQKGIKGVSSFRLKHVFAKKTIVRKDNIDADHYAERYDEDRKREEKEQERRDRDIADNYRFQFKTSKQNSDESCVCSPADSPVNQIVQKKIPKYLSELSGDESGMELSPPKRKPGIRESGVESSPPKRKPEIHEKDMEMSSPKRKPGIAATRFSAVRNPPLNMSLEEDLDEDDDDDDIIAPNKFSAVRKPPLKMSREEDQDDDNDDDNANKNSDDNDDDDDIELDELDIESPKRKPNTSSLYEIQKQKSPQKSQVSSPKKFRNFRDTVKRLTNKKPVTEETEQASEKKRKAPLSPQQSEEKEGPEKPFDVIKHNFKRLQKTIKAHHPPNTAQSGAESENDETNPETKSQLTKTQQITERLKRFRSVDNVDKNNEDDENKTQESPMRRIQQKLLEWKNNIKKKPDDVQNSERDDDDDAASSQKRDRPVGSLMKKLKHIRSRKHASTDDPDEDEEGGDTYKESLGARAKLHLEKGVAAASQVPQRTMKKISETKKLFHKKKEQQEVVKNKSEPTKTDEENDDEDEDNEDEDNEEEEPKQIKPTTNKVVPKFVLRPPPPPPLPRPYYRDSSEEDVDDDEENHRKRISINSKPIALPAISRTAWTSKAIQHSDDTTDYDDEIPRVLIHQDNSDIFESTLIIAVTRPRSRATTPIITELPPDATEVPPDSTENSSPDTKPDNWIPSSQIISGFIAVTPPSQSIFAKESISKGHCRKQSIDSSSEDSWIKDVPRDISTAGLSAIYGNDEPWKIASVKEKDEEEEDKENVKLHKAKSIDIFEFHQKNGGAFKAFEDFDDELKNTPVVKIEEPKLVEIYLHTASFERDSSEELDNPDDDDNSSRITKILVHPSEIKEEEPKIVRPELKSQPFGNSRESLMGNLDDNDDNAIGSEEDEDNEYSDEDDDDDDDEDEDDKDDRPPSKAPSPPPSLSTPPPPLPDRQPSIRLSKLPQALLENACPSLPPPPLPLTKPPIPPNRPVVVPPKIPDRTVAMSHISKPLVKTSSLRLAYSEQVNPKDVGKVNKLISRFEPEGGHKPRPRIIPRKPYIASESDEDSDNEDEYETNKLELLRQEKRDKTPTNLPRMQKSFSIDAADIPNNNNNNNISALLYSEINTSSLPSSKATSQILLDSSTSLTSIPSISISSSCLDVNSNSNFSQPNSVYGSPLTYPSSLVGSNEVTPLSNRRDCDFLATRRNRSRRSLQRDDENFYSFDSDDENSYYSISSTSSSRYIVEL